MRVLELYSGIGGMHYALRESGVDGEVIASVDINTLANEVYKYNFKDTLNMNRNIQSLDIDEVRGLNIDTILMSPPCQPFTRVGSKKDVSDNRAFSFLHILSLIPQIETLKYVLVENVKGFENSQARNELTECLRNSEFNYKEFILSPCQFGIPNTRHRYYMIAKRKGSRFCFQDNTLADYLSDEALKLLPNNKYEELVKQDVRDSQNSKKCYRLERILDECGNDNKYLVPEKLLERHAQILDVRTSGSNGSCCFTKAYGRYMEGTGSVFCPFTEEIIAEKYLASKMLEDDSERGLKPLVELKLRFFTPKEIGRLMCFPENFEFPETVSVKQRFRLLGNSINVYVVSRLILLLTFD